MNLHKSLTTITPFSKFLALTLFIALPIIGFILGVEYQKSVSYVVIEEDQYPFVHPTPTKTPLDAQNYETKDECLAIGGVWKRWGLAPLEFCQIPSGDGGKSCKDGSECEYGLCKSERRSTNGICATFQQEFGCYSIIENGKAGSAICVD